MFNVIKLGNLCESYGFLRGVYFIKLVIGILQVLIPLILIVTILIEMYPLIVNPGDVKKVTKSVKNKLIAAVIIFLLPSIVNIVMNQFDKKSNFATCYNNATAEGVEAAKSNTQTKKDGQENSTPDDDDSGIIIIG